ncbi:MAG: potassium channel family protein [Candidatus Geothermincolia bacterium]
MRPLRVVIMGCGRVGSRIARRLVAGGHQVSVIDKNPEAFHLLGMDFAGTTVEGIGFDRDVLIRAGIEQADAFIAVSSGDNSNFVSSRIAKDAFRVPKVITRIFDPRRAKIYRHVGVPSVAPVAWAVTSIMNILFVTEAHARETFGSGEVQMMEFDLPIYLDGRQVHELEVPGEVDIACIERAGGAILPVAGTALEKNDRLQVLVHRSSMELFTKMYFGA